MPLRFQYTPPRFDARALLAAAAPAAAHAAAEIILAKSQDLVPVDQGDLKASGHVEGSAHGARIVYDATSPEGYPYGIRQHEDLTLHHPNGGQAKFLEQPMNSEGQAVIEAMTVVVRKALEL